MQNARKKLMFGVGVAGTVLALASTAFACTTFKGKATVTTGSLVSTAYGDSSAGMKLCGTTPGAQVSTAGGTIAVAVSPTGSGAPAGCPSSKLDPTNNSSIRVFARHYYVYWTNPNGFAPSTTVSGGWNWDVDCMAGTGSTLLQATSGSNEFIVDSSGNGSGSYTVPSGQTANTATDLSAACVSDTGAGQGNQIPVKVVSI